MWFVYLDNWIIGRSSRDLPMFLCLLKFPARTRKFLRKNVGFGYKKVTWYARKLLDKKTATPSWIFTRNN